MTTSLTISAFAHRRSLRALTLGAAFVATVGLGGPAAALADDAVFDPPTQNERSIVLIESKEAPVFAPLTQNQRSILAIESKEAPVATAAFQPPTANERSIALIESKEAPGGVLAGGVPDTVRSGNR